MSIPRYHFEVYLQPWDLQNAAPQSWGPRDIKSCAGAVYNIVYICQTLPSPHASAGKRQNRSTATDSKPIQTLITSQALSLVFMHAGSTLDPNITSHKLANNT